MQYDMVRYGTVQYGTVTARFDSVQVDSVRFGSVGSARLGSARLGSVRCGAVRIVVVAIVFSQPRFPLYCYSTIIFDDRRAAEAGRAGSQVEDEEPGSRGRYYRIQPRASHEQGRR